MHVYCTVKYNVDNCSLGVSVRERGMHCLKSLFLRRHCQHSGVDLEPSFSSSHISISLPDCTIVTTLALEVILVTYATLKSYCTELNRVSRRAQEMSGIS